MNEPASLQQREERSRQRCQHAPPEAHLQQDGGDTSQYDQQQQEVHVRLQRRRAAAAVGGEEERLGWEGQGGHGVLEAGKRRKTGVVEDVGNGCQSERHVHGGVLAVADGGEMAVPPAGHQLACREGDDVGGEYGEADADGNGSGDRYSVGSISKWRRIRNKITLSKLW